MIISLNGRAIYGVAALFQNFRFHKKTCLYKIISEKRKEKKARYFRFSHFSFFTFHSSLFIRHSCLPLPPVFPARFLPPLHHRYRKLCLDYSWVFSFVKIDKPHTGLSCLSFLFRFQFRQTLFCVFIALRCRFFKPVDGFFVVCSLIMAA